MEVSSQRKLSPQRPFRTLTYLWCLFLLGKIRGTLLNSRNSPQFRHNLAWLGHLLQTSYWGHVEAFWLLLGKIVVCG